jgi:hypothetical protein
MKMRIVAVVIPFALLLASLSFAQNSEHKMVQFQMALLKKGPKWQTTPAAERSQIPQPAKSPPTRE